MDFPIEFGAMLRQAALDDPAQRTPRNDADRVYSLRRMLAEKRVARQVRRPGAK